MKNILNEKPSTDLTGRLKYSVNLVQDEDIKDKSILDIGCGYGWCELNFLKRGVRKMCGIEISDEDLKTIKSNITATNAEFKIGSAIKIPYDDQSFETVVAWEVIEHIPENTEEKMFEEVSRVLKPGGHFYLSTPYNQFLSNILDPAWWLIKHRHYTKNQLTAFGNNHGFEVKQIEVKGRIWSLLSVINMYIAKWVFRRKGFFFEFFRKKDDIEYQSMDQGYFNIFVKYRKL